MSEWLRMGSTEAGLQISFEKTQYVTKIKISLKQIKLGWKKYPEQERFKYFGEWIGNNPSEKETLFQEINKMNLLYRLTMNTYNKKTITINAKLRDSQIHHTSKKLNSSRIQIL